eukprot:maker-scaffold67_size430214-snap-gene-1.17 protein:Tk00772 transcript:maker-scaffold67_size430214-snap-gene-1.17-mRNA-1 annotation:"solute carrier family 46 member 3-like isoform x1"
MTISAPRNAKSLAVSSPIPEFPPVINTTLPSSLLSERQIPILLATSNAMEGLKKFQKSVSLEPVIFLYVFSNYIMFGAEQGANLKMTKFCELQLGYNKTTCNNRAIHRDVELEVQLYTNMFDLRRQYISMGPILLYTLVAGALSDDFGRKPLLLFPILGRIVGKSIHVLSAIFYYELPLWMYYFTEFHELMGGIPIYYMGVYGYGSNTVKQEKRAARLARFDGVEQIANVVGLALSPIAFMTTGYLGSFLMGTGCNILALLYLIFYTPEPILTREDKGILKCLDSNDPLGTKAKKMLHRVMVTPIVDMCTTIFKRRAFNLRMIMFLAFANYGIYLFTLGNNRLQYLYLKRVFPNFKGEDMAIYNVIVKTFALINLFVLMPLFNGKMGWHETKILSIISSSLVVSFLCRGFARNLVPEFYAAGILGFLQMGLFCTNRSLITRCIQDDEIGKAFSGVAILTSVCMAISQPVYRLLYDATLDGFPGAIYVLTALVLAVASVVNVYMFTQRRHIQVGESEADVPVEELELG